MKTAKSVARRAFGIVLSLAVILSMLMAVCSCKKTGDVADSGTATVVVAVGSDVRMVRKADGSNTLGYCFLYIILFGAACVTAAVGVVMVITLHINDSKLRKL